MTTLGSIDDTPKGWKVVKLGDICKQIKSGGTPLTTKREYWNGNIPFVKIEDITSSGKYLTKTNTFISENGLKNSNAWIVPKNSLLLAMYGSLGEVSINKIPAATNQAILGIMPNDTIDIEFLYYWFLYFKKQWKKFAKPTTQANLTAEIVKNTKLPLPPLPEQKAIAKILSTVDEAIQKVDEAIAKTERLKKGLMQKLLTKGIGHKEFKYSKELGCEIPREWEVTKLKDVIRYKKGKKPKIMIEEQKEGYLPYLTADNLRTGVFTQWAREDEDVVKVDKNDIILIWDGFYCGFTFRGFEGILSSTMVKVEPRPGINENFLFYVLKTHFRELNTKISGMYLKHVNKTVFENLKIPLPPLSEQQKIAEILSTVDKKLELERKRKEKLERIKKGLMNDLLTGRKRVNVEKILNSDG